MARGTSSRTDLLQARFSNTVLRKDFIDYANSLGYRGAVFVERLVFHFMEHREELTPVLTDPHLYSRLILYGLESDVSEPLL